MSATATPPPEGEAPTTAAATPLNAATTSPATEKAAQTTQGTSTTGDSGNGGADRWILLAYGTLVGVWAASQVVSVPYVVHLLVLVMSILYVACHNSLVLREHVPREGEEGYDPDSPVPPVETLRREDAMQFPIVGSMSLFGLYLAFKFLGQDLVNLLIGGYFAAVGCGALTLTIAPWMDLIMPQSVSEVKWGWKRKISSHPRIPEWILPREFELGIEFTGTETVAFVLGCAVVAMYFQKKHWALNNVIGICFCLQGIERLSLGTYKIGAILLVGLFFYDIFWVFGT
jgi:Signal peptide peptidase